MIYFKAYYLIHTLGITRSIPPSGRSSCHALSKPPIMKKERKLAECADCEQHSQHDTDDLAERKPRDTPAFEICAAGEQKRRQLCAQLGLHGDAGLPVKTEQKCLPGCAQKADLRIIVFDGSGVAGGNADFVSECDTDDHRLAAVGDAGAAVAHACGVTLKKEIDAQHKCDKGRSQHDQRQNLAIA